MEQSKKVKNLKDKLLNAAGKYSDYRRYSDMIGQVEEEYDETLELYNLDIWYGNAGGAIRDKAAHMLRITGKLFRDMVTNAETELISVLEEIANCSREEQKKIWERDLFLDKEKIDSERIKDWLIEWDRYPYDQDEALEFLVRMVEEIVSEIF